MRELAESLTFLHQNDMKVILVVGQSLEEKTSFNAIKVIILFINLQILIHFTFKI